MGKTALDAERGATLFKMDPADIIVVGYDTDDGLEHVLVNERVLKMKREGFSRPDLVDSMMTDGQLQNCIVRKNGKHDNGRDRVEAIVGRNRVLAGREINRLLVEAGQEPTFRLNVTLKKENDGLSGLVEAENNVRRDDDVYTKALNASRLLRLGMDEKKVAQKMGMTPEVLANHLEVLTLSTKMQEAVKRGIITATAAATFSDLSHEEQDKKIDDAESAGLIITVPEARRQRKARSNARKNGGKPVVSTRGKGVAIGVLRKLFDDEEFVGNADTSAKHLLSWIVGEGSYKSVPGLAAALRRIGEIE